MILLDQVFSALFQVVPYDFFESVMAAVVVFQFTYTVLLEPFDIL
jgi:hypothetical protein